MLHRLLMVDNRPDFEDNLYPLLIGLGQARQEKTAEELVFMLMRAIEDYTTNKEMTDPYEEIRPPLFIVF